MDSAYVGEGRDDLTGLPDRRALQSRVHASLNEGPDDREPDFAVLAVDVDGLDWINRRYGREGGDRVLREVAYRVVGCFRKWDTVSRLAADLIGVHLGDLKPTFEPGSVATRVRRAMAPPVDVAGRAVPVSICVGVAVGDRDCRSADDALRAAEKALARAKARGPDQVEVFSPSGRTGSADRRERELRLTQRLENEELALRYQPIVELSSGRIEGVEALIRWGVPGPDGFPPREIISVAEETGLIVGLGEWTLEKACREAKRWREGPSRDSVPRLSVNVSPRQLAEGDLPRSIEGVLERTGYPAEALRLEITETAVMGNPELTISTLRKLRELGVRIHLDDFGTGHSALAYLSELPVDSVKIDRAFIRKMAESAPSLDVIRTIVTLARRLGLTVVAEGVETREQEELLHEMACDYVQGFRFHRPLSGEGVEDVLSVGNFRRDPASS